MPSSKRMQIQSYGLSDIGCVRTNNEDGLYLNDQEGIYFVTDGMGGVNGGEIASGMIVDQLPKMLTYTLEKNPSLERTETQAAIQEDIHALNDLIFREGIHQGFPGMGATLTLAIVQEGRLYLFQIGDSRAYLYRLDQLKQLTKDQVVIEDGHEVLSHVMGMEEHLQAEVSMISLEHEDKILLCTDGIQHMMENSEIEEVFKVYQSGVVSGELIKRANNAGGADNSTAVVLEVKE